MTVRRRIRCLTEMRQRLYGGSKKRKPRPLQLCIRGMAAVHVEPARHRERRVDAETLTPVIGVVGRVAAHGFRLSS
jgi:hypothetical protein